MRRFTSIVEHGWSNALLRQIPNSRRKAERLLRLGRGPALRSRLSLHSVIAIGLGWRIANSRGPETLASLTKELGPSVVPKCIQDARKAKMIFLAVPFPAHQNVAKQFKQWNGKIVVDLTNALRVPPEVLGALLSSEMASQAFAGARLVKAFSHLPAAQLGTNLSLEGQRQIVFVSSNDADASVTARLERPTTGGS